MGHLTIALLASLILVAAAVACVFLVLRRPASLVDVSASLELTPQDGWSLLNLVLSNCGESKVWIEQAAFVIAGLDAEMQGAPSTSHGALNIREFVRSREDLRVSLIEAVYNAAGKPQGAYGFHLLGAVRYRVDGQWMELETPVYEVDMVRLSATRLRRIRTTAASGAAGIASPLTLLDSTETAPTRDAATPQPSSHEDFKGIRHSA